MSSPEERLLNMVIKAHNQCLFQAIVNSFQYPEKSKWYDYLYNKNFSFALLLLERETEKLATKENYIAKWKTILLSEQEIRPRIPFSWQLEASFLSFFVMKLFLSAILPLKDLKSGARPLNISVQSLMKWNSFHLSNKMTPNRQVNPFLTTNKEASIFRSLTPK